MRRVQSHRTVWKVYSAFAMFALTIGTTPGAADEPAPAKKSIDAAMSAFVKDGKASGVVTLVAKEGKLVHLSAIGEADIDSHRAMKTDAMFAIASMTKPITATALMILMDEGKLSLDDPASKYVPEFQSAKLENEPAKREITVRDLLTHTSGIPGDQANVGTLKATAEKMAQRPLAFQPGSKWQYGPGLSIIGRIVEVVSEQPFEAFVDERILHPLKMNDTTFFPTEKQRARLASLYQPGKDGTPFAPATHFLLDFSKERTPNPSGGLFSTASDLARFYQMVLNGGELDGTRVLSKKAVEQMTRIQTGDLQTGFTPGNGWGLGWCVIREPQGVTRTLKPGACGHGGAFGTQGWIDPSRNMVFVMLIQRTGFGSGDGSDLRGAFQQAAVEAFAE